LSAFVATLALWVCGVDAHGADRVSADETPAPAFAPIPDTLRWLNPPQRTALLDRYDLQAAPIRGYGFEGYYGIKWSMVAAQVQIPTGWQILGRVAWSDTALCGNGASQANWIALAPDGRSAIGQLPGLGWHVTGAGTGVGSVYCAATLPYRSVREYLEAVAQIQHPGARVLEYKPLGETANTLRELLDAGGKLPVFGIPTESGQLLIGYTEGGVLMREVLRAKVNFFVNTERNLSTSPKWSIFGIVAVIDFQRAPEGKLDVKLGERVLGSLREDVLWKVVRQRRESDKRQENERGRSTER
jgi:hypothetical protein